MMTKKQFILLMNRYIELDADVSQVNKAFKKLSPDFGCFMLEKHDQLFLDTVKVVMNDEYDWIDYWLFDLDCGKKWEKGKVIENGNDIPLKTLSDLYDLLAKP